MPKSSLGKRDKVRNALSNRLHAVSNAKLEELLGLSSISKPASEPTDINKADLPLLNSKQLSRCMQYCTGMLAYALSKTAESENRLAALCNFRNARRSQLYVLYNGDKKPKWKIEAELEDDMELREVDGKVEVEKAHFVLLKAHINVWEARVSMFSREQTRRSQEIQRGT